MHVVHKGDTGKVRITTDFSALNRFIKREVFSMPGVDYTMAQLGGAKVFSKLDCNSGFFQLKLDEESKKLTCFMTPFGRYQYRRLPQGASSSPEVFCKRISTILSGLEGVIFLVDDIAVFGPDKETHDKRLLAVLKRLNENHVTLNFEKCKFGMTSLKFLGMMVDGDGIRKDPLKVQAIADFPAPTDVTEVRRFLGLFNQVAKFVANVSQETTPIRSLLQKDRQFLWGPDQSKCFENLKNLLISDMVLAHYDPKNPTRVETNASFHGLGITLFQEVQDVWRPAS